MAGADRGGGGGTTAPREAPLIRDATPADALAIAQIHVDSWRAAYRDLLPAELLAGLSVDRRKERWDELLRDSTEPVLVAELDGELLGFAGLGISRDEEGKAELYAIYLDPARFGTGVGRALMDAALERMRELGYREAMLWVLDGNERAERFYRLAGWRRDGATKTELFGDVPLAEALYRREL